MSEAPIPQANINDLITAHQSVRSGSGDPVSNFIKMLGNYALQGANSVGKGIGDSPILDPMTREGWVANKILGKIPTVGDADSFANNVMSGNWDPSTTSPYSITQPNVAPLLQGKSTSLGGSLADTAGLAMMGHLAGTHGGEPASTIDAQNAVDEVNPSESIPPEVLGKGDFVNPSTEMKINPGKMPLSDDGGPVMPPSQMPAQTENGPQPIQEESSSFPKSSYKKQTPTEINPNYDTNADTGRAGSIRIQPEAELSGPRNQVIAQQATDNIPGNTATLKFQNAEPRMAELGQQKDVLAAGNTTPISEQQLQQNYLNKISQHIAPSGTTPTDAQVTLQQAELMADNQIRQYQAKSGITPGIDGQGNKSYTVEQVSKMKDESNIYNKKLLEARGNGVTLTPAQQIELAGRDGLQETLAQAAPEVGKITQEQSGIYDAVPQLHAAAEKEYQTQLAAPKTIGGKIGQVIQKNPLLAAAVGGLGFADAKNIPDQVGGLLALGSKAIKSGIGSLNTAVNGSSLPTIPPTSPTLTQSTTQSTTPSTQSGVQSTEGRYSIPNINNMGLLTGKALTDKENELTQQIADADAGSNTVAAKKLGGQLTQLQNSATSQQKIQTESENANTIMSTGNRAVSLMNLNGSYASMLNSTDPKYAALGTALQNLQKMTGVDISSAVDKDSLIAKLDEAMSAAQQPLNAALANYYGGNTLNANVSPNLTNLPHVQNIQPQQKEQIGVPVDYHGNFNGKGGGLPPINQLILRNQ